MEHIFTSAPAANLSSDADVRVSNPSRQAYQILHLGFTVAPILAGLDKFFNLLVNWEQYLPPFVNRLTGGQRAPDFAQHVFESFGREPPLQRGDQTVEQRVVGFGEEALRLGRQLVGEVRPAEAPLQAALPDQPIPFERKQVCANGVVRQLQL